MVEEKVSMLVIILLNISITDPFVKILRNAIKNWTEKQRK
jgi:hypothetical protein